MARLTRAEMHEFEKSSGWALLPRHRLLAIEATSPAESSKVALKMAGMVGDEGLMVATRVAGRSYAERMKVFRAAQTRWTGGFSAEAESEALRAAESGASQVKWAAYLRLAEERKRAGMAAFQSATKTRGQLIAIASRRPASTATPIIGTGKAISSSGSSLPGQGPVGATTAAGAGAAQAADELTMAIVADEQFRVAVSMLVHARRFADLIIPNQDTQQMPGADADGQETEAKRGLIDRAKRIHYTTQLHACICNYWLYQLLRLQPALAGPGDDDLGRPDDCRGYLARALPLAECAARVPGTALGIKPFWEPAKPTPDPTPVAPPPANSASAGDTRSVQQSVANPSSQPSGPNSSIIKAAESGNTEHVDSRPTMTTNQADMGAKLPSTGADGDLAGAGDQKKQEVQAEGKESVLARGAGDQTGDQKKPEVQAEGKGSVLAAVGADGKMALDGKSETMAVASDGVDRRKARFWHARLLYMVKLQFDEARDMLREDALSYGGPDWEARVALLRDPAVVQASLPPGRHDAELRAIAFELASVERARAELETLRGARQKAFEHGLRNAFPAAKSPTSASLATKSPTPVSSAAAKPTPPPAKPPQRQSPSHV